MPLTVHDVSVLHEYALGVMNRADHHAKDVEEIALALIGAIVWRKDDAEPIRVLSSKGATGNVLWATISGQKYAFSYNHQTKQIEMREGSTQGAVLHSFDNTTSLAKLKAIFETL